MFENRIRSRAQDWLDGAAVAASTLCLLHCLALPVLLAALPILAEGLGLGIGMHAVMLLVAAPTSALALAAGYRRHGAIVPVVSGSTGLLLLMAGLIALRPSSETILTVAGSMMLAAAHFHNWRLRRHPRR